MEVKNSLPPSETIIYTGVSNDLVEVEVISDNLFERFNVSNDRIDVSLCCHRTVLRIINVI